MGEKTKVPTGYTEELGTQFWNPENDGDILEGVVVDAREGKIGDKETGKSYLIENATGQYWTPSHAVLQNRLAKVKVQDYIRIVFEGEDVTQKKKGQNAPKMYSVFRKK